MKKRVVLAVIALFLLVGGSSAVLVNSGEEVDARSGKTHCVITKSNGFYCEGNPGYEEALRQVGGR